MINSLSIAKTINLITYYQRIKVSLGFIGLIEKINVNRVSIEKVNKKSKKSGIFFIKFLQV